MMTTCRTAWNRRTLWSSTAIVLGSILLLGCGQTPHSGKPTAQVTVAVTQGGRPVTEGRVDLGNDKTGEGGGGELNGQGVATIPAVPLGSYTVIVVPAETPVVPGVASQPAPPKKEEPGIPAKVRSFKSSPFKAEVKKDSSNQFQFELKAG